MEKTVRKPLLVLGTFLTAFFGLFFSVNYAKAVDTSDLEILSWGYDGDLGELQFTIKNNSTVEDTLYYVGAGNCVSPTSSDLFINLYYFDIKSGDCDGVYQPEIEAGGTCVIQPEKIEVNDGSAINKYTPWPTTLDKTTVDDWFTAQYGLSDVFEVEYPTITYYYSLLSDAWSEVSPPFPFGGATVLRSFEINPTLPKPSATSTYQTGVQDDPGAVELYGMYAWQPGESDLVLEYTDGTGAWYKTIDTWGWYAKAKENDTEREFLSYVRFNDYVGFNGDSGVYDRFIYLPDGTYSLTYKLVRAHYSTSTQTYAYTYYEPDNGNATSTLIVLGSSYVGGTTTTTVPIGKDPDTSIVNRWIKDQTTTYFDTLSHRIPLNYVIPFINALDDFEYPEASSALALDLDFTGTSSAASSIDFSGFADTNIVLGEQTKTLRDWSHLICRIFVLVGLVLIFWKLFKWITAPSKTNV